MQRRRIWISTVALAGLFSVSIGRAQGPPPATPLIPPPATVVIDDQLIDVTGAVAIGEHTPRIEAGSRVRFKPQGVTVDSDAFPLRLKFNGWDGGVVPIEFESDVTTAERDQFMRVCATTWGQAAPVMCILRTSQNGYLRVAATIKSNGRQ